MKKLTVLLSAALCMLLFSLPARAQLYFGGSIGLTSSTLRYGVDDDKPDSGISFKFAPEVGYKITDHIAAGASISFQRGLPYFGNLDTSDLNSVLNTGVGTESDLGLGGNNSNRRFTGFCFAPYFRYVIVDSRRFSLFVDAVPAFSSFKMEKKTNDKWESNDNYSVFEIGARPGFVFKLDSKHFAIVGYLGNLGFQSMTNSNPDNEKINLSRFGLSLDSNHLSLGFTYTL